MTKNSVGRPKATSLEKALGKAARAYHHLQEMNKKTESEYESERMFFAQTEKTMGRPAVFVDRSKGHRNQFHAEMLVNRETANEEWLAALKEFRAVELKMGETPIPETDIHTYKKHMNVGRPAANRIDKLKKYIRREDRLVKDIQLEIDAGAIDEVKEFGRKIIPRAEKVRLYKAKIKEAQQEIDNFMDGLSPKERIKYDVSDLRVESREITMFLKYKITKDEAITKQNELNEKIAKLGISGNINQSKKLRVESRSLTVFINSELEVISAKIRQKEIKAEIESKKDLEIRLGKYEQMDLERANEFKQLKIEKELRNKKAAEIKKQNELQDSAYKNQIEDENEKLIAAIKAMGGDVDAILNKKSDEKTG